MGISISTLILIQDVQLLCFTIVFGVLALQQWNDSTRRWLLCTFLANCAEAVIDLFPGSFPTIISRGIDPMLIPLSYALLNVTFVRFDRRGQFAVWLSAAALVLSLPLFLVWSSKTDPVWNDSLGDLMIAVEVGITPAILLTCRERSTRAPRALMSGFFAAFALLEFYRAWVAFGLHASPDTYSPNLTVISAVAYVITVSILPLGVIWMMHARLEAELQMQAATDPLTHVLNRRGLADPMDRELAYSRRFRQDLSVILIDLDRFKNLNDTYGHRAGDEVLATVGKMLRSRLRDIDIVARIGGEEFLVLLPRTTLSDAELVATQLCHIFRETTHLLSDVPVHLTISCGITSTRGGATLDKTELLQQADAALYRAKGAGRDCVRVFSSEEELAGYRFSSSLQ